MEPAPPAAGPRSAPLTLAMLAFAALGAAVLGAFVYEHLAAPPRSAVPAAELPALPSTDSASLKIPEQRPVFALADLEGHSHSITEWDGKDLMVNFWATWCAPCRREIPLLNRLQAEFAPRGVTVIGIAVDVADDVRAFRAKLPIDYPLLTGEQDGLDAARDFGVTAMAFPFTAFTDAKGRILTVHLGELHEDQARAILAVASQVDSGQLDVSAGRAAIRTALAALPKPAT